MHQSKVVGCLRFVPLFLFQQRCMFVFPLLDLGREAKAGTGCLPMRVRTETGADKHCLVCLPDSIDELDICAHCVFAQVFLEKMAALGRIAPSVRIVGASDETDL
jgi:hypothetical protein